MRLNARTQDKLVFALFAIVLAFFVGLFIIALEAQTPVTVVATYNGRELRRGEAVAKGELVKVPYHVIRGANGATVNGKPAVGVIEAHAVSDIALLATSISIPSHSFAEFLSAMEIRQELLGGFYLIPGSSDKQLTWTQAGDGWLEGTFTIEGGSKDIGIRLRADDASNVQECESFHQMNIRGMIGTLVIPPPAAPPRCTSNLIWNPGFMQGVVRLHQALKAGVRYSLILDNVHSVVTPKRITGKVYAVSYK